MHRVPRQSLTPSYRGGIASLHPIARIDGRDVFLDRLGSRDVGLAARGVAASELGESARVKRAGVLWVHCDRCTQVRDGAFVVALVVVGVAPVAVGSGVFRIEPDRLVEISDGAV